MRSCINNERGICKIYGYDLSYQDGQLRKARKLKKQFIYAVCNSKCPQYRNI